MDNDVVFAVFVLIFCIGGLCVTIPWLRETSPKIGNSAIGIAIDAIRNHQSMHGTILSKQTYGDISYKLSGICYRDIENSDCIKFYYKNDLVLIFYTKAEWEIKDPVLISVISDKIISLSKELCKTPTITESLECKIKKDLGI